ncbi:MAG: D-amino-acid transaminase [Ignavibacteriales bacterium]
MEEITAYLNGRFVPYGEAKIGVEDRGYQFGDGVYEVIRVYDGKPFRMKEHLDRLVRSAGGIGLSLPDRATLTGACMEIIRRNSLKGCSLYIQVSRGVCPRKHSIPCDIEPTVVIIGREISGPPAEYRANGVKAITVADDRWARCYLKTTNLLPNILAKQKAERAGAYEAIFVRDGFVTEGSSTNTFIVESGVLVTPALTNYILGGVTRAAVIEAARSLGIEVKEDPIPVERLLSADEVWATATVAEMMPIVNINGAGVGEGKPGPMFSGVYAAYVKMYSGGQTM